jgi:AraC-like DNA-binding protein
MQKIADAWAMRIRGATWAEIAAAVGYASPQNAMRAVRRYAGTLPEPSMPELRSLWRERLEYLWPLAARDVEAGKPGATRAAVAIAQRAAAMSGLDAAQKVTIDFNDREVQAQLFQWLNITPDQLEIEGEVIDDADVVED